jgi:hypothetical protein
VSRLPDNSLIVGDRLYCAYFLFADALRHGHDAVIRLTTSREQKLGRVERKKRAKNHWIITWKRPPKPSWMSQEEYGGYAISSVATNCHFSNHVDWL